MINYDRPKQRKIQNTSISLYKAKEIHNQIMVWFNGIVMKSPTCTRLKERNFVIDFIHV